ncbi:hypothetical protein DENSPDRAFT_773726 [Dentipellis sp. KUC8613]|nr:hypothetical protein DENSPDRAFT_773726 [Dentipellis sp. KUC8613]
MSAEAGTHEAANAAAPDAGARRPIYQKETTGNYWSDVKEAAKRIGEIPCARNSLLSGIASGFGIGVIRGLSVRPFVACNWAVATFMAVSLGTWTICQNNLNNERLRIQQVVEDMPKRTLKKDASQAGQESS